MQLVKIELDAKKYSTMFFTNQLIALTCSRKYSNAEIIIRTVSENGASQAVDAKTYLGMIAILSGKQANELVFEVRGENEVYDANQFKYDVLKILEQSNN
jgi:hypothetical protein